MVARKPIRLTEEQYTELVDDSMGICLNCRRAQSGCEPDARRYKCEECGAPTVYGTEECLLMGCVAIVDSSDEAEDV